MLLFLFQLLFGNDFKLYQKAGRVAHRFLMRLLCPRLLEGVLGYINAVAQSVERNADRLTGKFWRALLSRAYDMLDKVGLPFSPVSVHPCCFYVSLKHSFTLRINLPIASLNIM